MKNIVVLLLTLTNVFAFNLRGFQSPESTVREHIFPYQVCISFLQSNSKRSLCSGSLIDNEWVLTAAHCAANAVEATVYLGASSGETAEVIQTVTEDDIIVHPEWDDSTGSNDISVVKIPYSSYSDKIQPIKLPSASSFYGSYNGDIAIATGWHHESNTFSSAKSKLKWTSLQVAPKKICAGRYGALPARNTICAVTEETTAACSTDSGGPLVLEFSKVQIGLNALIDPQDGCSETNSVLFTPVSDYLDWIEANTGISY